MKGKRTSADSAGGIDRSRKRKIASDKSCIGSGGKSSVAKSIEERAEIRALDHGINAADYKIQAERTWWVPKVQLMASLYYIGLYSNRIENFG